jgi:hypothetical protein
MTPETWAAALLARLNIPQTPGAMQAVIGWERAEGGHWNNSARFNPLNTTQPMPGYTTFQSVGVGSAPIGIYKSWDQGLDATVATLKNGRYSGILAGLRTGNASSVATAIGSSPWGTSAATIRSAIGATSAPKKTVPAGAAPASGPSAGAQPTVDATAGSDLFSDISGGMKYTTVWLAVVIGGLLLALAGLDRAMGRPLERTAGKIPSLSGAVS